MIPINILQNIFFYINNYFLNEINNLICIMKPGIEPLIFVKLKKIIKIFIFFFI